MCEIIRVPVGRCNAYVLRSSEAVALVDTGVSWRLGRLRASLRAIGLEPTDIALIIATHCHYDHVGSLAAMKGQSGAKVLVHESETQYLERGSMALPPGTNGILRAVVATAVTLFPHSGRFAPLTPDIVVGSEYDLSPHGIEGVVLHTPGHTQGSVSVVLGSAAVVGDLMYDIGRRTVFPPFAEEGAGVLSSWERLLAMGMRELHPGHGRCIDSQRLRRSLDERRSRK